LKPQVCFSSKNEVRVVIKCTGQSSQHLWYQYQVYRKTKGGGWLLLPHRMRNVRVLNVFPKKPLLEAWMKTPLTGSSLTPGGGWLHVESVSIDDFNKDAESYMKANGKWKYDVVFFGSWDCNAHKDLSPQASDLVKAFVKEGKGVLFGHDTICRNFNHPNFASFGDLLGIVVEGGEEHKTWSSSTHVTIKKYSRLTDFPFVLRGKIEVPPCHSFGQYFIESGGATEVMVVDGDDKRIEKKSGARSGFYLVIKGKVAMIQTGHANEQSTDEERMLLANLLYLLAVGEEYFHEDVFTLEAPDAIFTFAEDGRLHLQITNNATTAYKIVAIPQNGPDRTPIECEPVTVQINATGFVVVFNNSSEPAGQDVLEFSEDGKIKGFIPADDHFQAVGTFSKEDVGGAKFAHVFTVGPENILSEERLIEIPIPPSPPTPPPKCNDDSKEEADKPSTTTECDDDDEDDDDEEEESPSSNKPSISETPCDDSSSEDEDKCHCKHHMKPKQVIYNFGQLHIHNM